MQTPSQTAVLELSPEDDDFSRSGLAPRATMQKIVRFDLREDGNHVLSVSLSYSENTISKAENSASSGRVRTFRKLYQFIARPCLSVRTKASELPSIEAGKDKPQALRSSRYALEAQIENLTDGLITLDGLTFDAKAPFNSRSLNWDIAFPDQTVPHLPKLAPQDITQVAFLVEEQKKLEQHTEFSKKELTKDGRTVLGMLTIQWRSAMGDPGILSTGWLTSKRTN
ncbi:MAG: hypothetical protein Q9187_000923 [Circinaria calcarea]